MKDPNPPGSGKDIAEGKGVHREMESEGSRMWEKTNYQREYMALSEYIAETSSIRVEAIEGEV